MVQVSMHLPTSAALPLLVSSHTLLHASSASLKSASRMHSSLHRANWAGSVFSYLAHSSFADHDHESTQPGHCSISIQGIMTRASLALFHFAACYIYIYIYSRRKEGDQREATRASRSAFPANYLVCMQQFSAVKLGTLQ
jgi:hypothetical protein